MVHNTVECPCIEDISRLRIGNQTVCEGVHQLDGAFKICVFDVVVDNIVDVETQPDQSEASQGTGVKNCDKVWRAERVDTNRAAVQE